MASAIFGTHAFVKRLTAVGMPEAQAEILAEEQARLIDERLATKADLAVLRSDLAAWEQRLRDQLTIRVGGMLTMAIAIMATLVKPL